MSLFKAIDDKLTGKVPEGHARDPRWRALEKSIIKDAKQCSVCSKKKQLEVHHLLPFHEHPELELDLKNLRVLCRRCHLMIGHLGNFRSYNPTALKDILEWNYKIESRP